MTNKMSMNIYFVLPSGYEDEHLTGEEMQQAFEICRQNQISPEWIREENCLSMNFNKSDIVVFEKFEGEIFRQVQTRLSVVGPWCLITCLLEGLQVPSNRSPIFNLAMYNLSITVSNYTPEEKKKMKEKVEMMGGTFNLHVTSNVTHLVTNSVRTQKYAAANSKGIYVMLDSWIEEVWDTSLTRRVKGTDEEFMKHKCPCFQNLRMCSTGFDIPERQNLQKLITTNGGLYSGKLLTTSTDILICKRGTKSDKLTVARKAKLPCVRIEWIYDSVEKGFALPEESYVIKVASSTPTKGENPPNPDFSIVSMISIQENQEHTRVSASESLNPSLYNMLTPKRNNTQKENQEPDVIAEIDLQAVRAAGTFLDGCGVLLVGFTPDRREKLCRILRCAGATRYDTPSDRVTQVLVGDPDAQEVRTLGDGAPHVTAAWLKESLRRKQPAPEEPFIIRRGVENSIPAPASPLSKKGLTLLQQDTSVLEPESRLIEVEPEEHESIKLYKINNEQDTLAQLLAQGNINSKFDTKSVQKANETEVTENDETWDLIFEGKTFKLLEHSDDDYEKLTNVVEELGGKVVRKSFCGVTDYAVVPIITRPIHDASTEIVNSLWVLECHARNELLASQYYHQPLIFSANIEPLKECVITVSGYTGFERTYIIQIIQELGAIYQDKFARISNEDNNVLKSTHLVCLEPIGSKWMAAQRWERCVVTHEWLLRCAETGKCVPEHQYALKDSNVKVNTLPAPTTSKENTKVTPDKKDRERRNVTLSTSKSKEKQSSQKDKQKIASSISMPKERNVSPVNDRKYIATTSKEDENTSPISNKRDHKGNRITPPSNTNKSSLPLSATKQKNIEGRMSPVFNSPTNSNVSLASSFVNNGTEVSKDITKETSLQNNIKPLEDPVITLEDGREVPLNIFMEELRAQGLFDTPSPIPFKSGTPVQEVIARLRREGKIPLAPSDDSPIRGAINSEIGGSQGTPVGRYLRGLKERNVLPTSPKPTPPAADSPIPRSLFDVKTPETPLGRFLGEDDPSRSTRKHWQRYIDRFPHYNVHDRPEAPPRRPSTPWSEVKRQAWSWLLREKEGDEIDASEDATAAPVEIKTSIPEPVSESQGEVSNQIGQIQDMLRRRESSGPSRSLLLALDGHGVSTSDPIAPVSDAKDSQAGTVDWDEPLEDCVFSESTSAAQGPRKFMMSVVEPSERASCCNIIRSLGGEVSDLKVFDPTATHVICSNPARNEKILSSMAAGLWVLHASYVQQSAAAGRFLPEELFELGNSKSTENLSDLVNPSPVTEAIHWWRQKVKETGQGAFHGMRSIINAKNSQAIVRLIEAGGGQVLQMSPPFNHNLEVTHCFLDAKKHDLREYIPLAEQGILCLNVVYLSNFLSSKSNVNTNEFIMPSLREYYR